MLADLDNVDPDLLQYDNSEHEIITDKGDFNVEIIDVSVYHHDHNDDHGDEDDDESKWDEKKWEEHNKESENENDQMEAMKEKISNLLAKHELVNTEIGLKKLLDAEKREDVAIGVIMKYGHKYPDVKEYARKHAQDYSKSYKHFSIPVIVAMHNVMQNSMR